MRRAITIVVGVVTVGSLLEASAGAEPLDPQTQPPPTVSVAASTPAAGGGGGGGSSDGGESGSGTATVSNEAVSGSPCESWQRVDISVDAHGADFYPGAKPFVEASPLGTASLYWRRCVGADGLPYYEEAWAADGASGPEPPAPTVDDLVPGVVDRATRMIPDPILDMSPPPEVGGIVNIGLWLAVEEPEAVTARAEAGSVWAQATATLVGLTWDLGNGDVIECSGFGDPIIDPNVREQSPYCGYTYEWPSDPQFTGAGNAYEASVTAHWNIQVTGSDGRDYAADPLDVTFEFLYPVCEIQALGVPADAAPSQAAGMSCAEAAGVGS